MITEKELAKRIGRRVKHFRMVRKLGQVKFAKLIGYSQSAVAQIETGVLSPRLDTLVTIANALKIEVATLMQKDLKVAI